VFGDSRRKRLACTLYAAAGEEQASAMLSNAPKPSASKVALHRSQRALVAASLLACPPRD
jgi:hypothetical protein